MKSLFRYNLSAAIILPAFITWVVTAIGVYFINAYGWTVFVVLPIFIGACSTYIYENRPADDKPVGSFKVTLWSLLLTCAGFLVFAIEGVICMVMAAPLAIFLAYAGYALCHFWPSGGYPVKRMMMPSFALLMPLSLLIDTNTPKPELYSITSEIVVNAPPEEVWKNVIQFPQLPQPKEIMFRSGIAYPINATIKGTGVGAIRYCNFSTGPFVEPITAWNEPKLLQFGVTSQPAPMKELSPFDIHPPHLDGFWTSEKGQFQLVALSDGNTLLKGTTWYRNRIRPVPYWNAWADYIVHTIHLRVLTHIKVETEKGNPEID